jgi:hypothetical protein
MGAAREAWGDGSSRRGEERVERRRRRSGERRRGGREGGEEGLASWLGEVLREHDQNIALVDGLALLAADLDHFARVFGLDGHLHLHRLEDRHGVALIDLVADGALDLPHRAGDMCLYLSHCDDLRDAVGRRRPLCGGIAVG